MHYGDCSYELGIQLMQYKLGLTKNEAEEESSTQWGGNISMPNLKKRFGCCHHFSPTNTLMLYD